ncbi:hypothetical protein AGMMS49525_18020 [Bacteroidia bacterium]|nr:hypothetical protein AGMMS49525_18020 [Bacteroidia bacterium]
MNKKDYPADMSYFRLALLAFLRESHPQLLSDEKFINARTEAALDVYEQSVKNGSNAIEAGYSANETLFVGLHFSKHDTLKNILWNEFVNEVPEDEAAALAIKLLPECESVFAGYPLSDDFADSSEYDLLYTELTGTITIYLEGHELQ